MSALEQKTAQTESRDLALLGQMVGVEKALNALVSRRVPLEKEVVLGVLEAQQEIYSSEGMFEKKGQALREIITRLEQGSIGVDAVVAAAGVDATKTKLAAGGFSFRRLWDRIRP